MIWQVFDATKEHMMCHRGILRSIAGTNSSRKDKITSCSYLSVPVILTISNILDSGTSLSITLLAKETTTLGTAQNISPVSCTELFEDLHTIFPADGTCTWGGSAEVGGQFTCWFLHTVMLILLLSWKEKRTSRCMYFTFYRPCASKTVSTQ